MTQSAIILTAVGVAFAMLTILGMSALTPAEGNDIHALPKPRIDLPATQPGETRTVVLAGGCFWCTEGAFAQFRGVKDVVSGYAGDTKDKADYRTVCTGTTNHAEA